jgi:L-2,4-diaminobutyric acid acetyltransferase
LSTPSISSTASTSIGDTSSRPDEAATQASIQLVKPTPSDGAEIYRLVRDGGTLELNTAYAYVLTGTHFSSTSVVARKGSTLVGFVWAYAVPERSNTLFVWQIGVAKECRGTGLATEMLRELLGRRECQRVTHVEATVTPSNEASLRLFHGLAAKLGANIQTRVGFDASLFPKPGHEPELLVRIGPIDPAD